LKAAYIWQMATKPGTTVLLFFLFFGGFFIVFLAVSLHEELKNAIKKVLSKTRPENLKKKGPWHLPRFFVCFLSAP
jgi:hypothetical protein